MEGLNDYVAYRGLLANGLHTREQFSGMLSKWHREYVWCVHTGNQRVMPYRRGMIAAWVFDIQLRRATDGKHGLTDVLLDLIRDKPPGGVVQRAHLVARLNKFSGEDMEALYEHLVEDDSAIDLAKYLAGTGFSIAKNRNIEIRPETESEKKLFEAILSE
jgi:predicted metalloprotease with PDZ domain